MRLRPLLLAVPALLLVGCGSDGTGAEGPATGTDGVGEPTTSSAPAASSSPTPSPAPSAPAASGTPSTTTAPTTTAPPSTPVASSSPAAPSTRRTDPALRKAVQAYADAFLVGDAPAAFDLLSERCKDTVDMESFGTDAITAGERYGAPQKISRWSETVRGSSATVSYSFAGGAPAKTKEPWVREAGFWQLDAC